MIESGAIPFQQGELGDVPVTPLMIAEDLSYLVDITAAGGQQTLHGKFRRGVKVAAAAIRRTRSVPDCGQAVDGRIGGRGDRQGRRIDLHDSMTRKVRADPRKQCGPQFKGLRHRRWPPAGACVR